MPRNEIEDTHTSANHWLFVGGLACAIGIFTLTVLVFLPSLDLPFIWDDEGNLLANDYFRGLTPGHLRWMFSTFHGGHYQPLTWLSWAVNYALGGIEDPRGYHLGNILLHALCAVLFFALTIRLVRLSTGRAPDSGLLWAASVVTLVFAIHPLRVESVAWITERRDGLSGVFFLAALLAYLRAADGHAHERLRPSAYILSLLCFAGALLAKVITVGLAPVLLVLDVYPLRRLGVAPVGWIGPRARRVYLEKLPFFALGLAIALLAPLSQTHAGAMVSFERHGLLARCAQALYGLVFYPWKCLWPVDLSPMYPLPLRLDPFAARYLISAALVVIGVIILVRIRWRWPAAAAAASTYALLLFPVLGFFQNGPQLVADRYSYLSCLGWTAALAAPLWMLWRRFADAPSRAMLIIACAVALGLLARRTRDQIQIWSDPVNLWRHAVDLDPDGHYLHNSLGTALNRSGDSRAAVEHLRCAVELHPEYQSAWYNLGVAQRALGDLPAAQQSFQRSLDLAPGHADSLLNLGCVLQQQGRLEDAIGVYRRAIALHPNASQLYTNLGIALVSVGRIDDALVEYNTALRLAPDSPEAHDALGYALGQLGRTDEAQHHLREAIRRAPTFALAHYHLIDLVLATSELRAALVALEAAHAALPDDPALANRLAWHLASSPFDDLRDPPRALHLAEALRAAAPRMNPALWDTFAAAYAALGRFDDALSAVDAGILLARQAGRDDIADAMTARRVLYAENKPYRAAPANE